ncbi:uroporphyrinogen-III synthase [Hoeflea olei]|uniref:Tetrapyrrole biosynthesis uroporphyrinogen III synthase domain-containing protein n=1 Tax=Hoeflea olei TaxID=1480615 RepID=A0A1C1YZK7_9HYPH|nr:uroporphyrinogen-III synthase [Hoeflea olei]OCW58938.1 hypothetical protein AWJ14_04255 [Hoeflea olei]
MRVLVTRPEPGGKRTAARLRRIGHEPVLMPLFKARVTAEVSDLPPAHALSGLIATSARAFDMFPAGAADPALGGLPVHAVGAATARAARAAGFRDVREGGGTARELADSLRASGAGDGRLLYLAGTPRTAVIEDSFKVERFAHEVLECYRMDEISYPTDSLTCDILTPFPEVVLLYSANAGRRLVELVEAEALGYRLDSARFLCLSETIAAELPARWRVNAAVAVRPNEDSLLASLTALG